MSLNEQQLQQVYQMVDSISLSRPKRHISRDFSDALLMAQVVQHFNPKIVALHNYPATNSVKQKIVNWNTLNQKVLKKIGIQLTKTQMQEVAQSSPNAVEQVLHQVLVRFQKPDEEGRLSINAKKMESKNNTHLLQTDIMTRLSEKPRNSMDMYVVQAESDRLQDVYKTQKSMQEQGEEINELSTKIEQVYAQLLKLNEINKAKQDMVRNLEKKVQKIFLS